MELSFDTFTLLVLMAPFAVALLAPTISRETGRAAGWILALVPAGLFVMLLSMIGDVAAGHPVSITVDWVPALGLRFSLLIDGLSLTFALLISGIGAFILVYSGDYLAGHPHRGRFFAFLLLFMGAMLSLVLADSLVALFVFWEMTSVTSFLLIGFDHTAEKSRRAAIQALIVTGIGGLALMAGGVLLYVVAGTWDISALAASPTLRQAGAAYPWVLGFILVAAFTKSAQVPFHFWLPNAMEAPTPVSAYLHSATMVQAGIYLLARLSPILAGTPQWQALLCTIGGATLLWGALIALKQTDLKQLLAHTTIASLGLLVMLLGIGGEAAAMAVATYFVAHALYKAALFLVTGSVDHATGSRDVTRLSGLRDSLTISFICTALAALSMFGVPPLLGYIAKEEIYAVVGLTDVWAVVVLTVIVVGNALLGTAALAVLIRPFMGNAMPADLPPREGGIALWIGPVAFGLLGLAVLFGISTYGDLVAAPMASAIMGYPVASHLTFAVDLTHLPVWLSLLTWVIAILAYMQLDRLRAALTGLERRFSWSFDKGFDQIMFGLIRIAGGWTRAFHHGRLELYLVVAVASLALVLLVPLWRLGGWPQVPDFRAGNFYEWGVIGLATIGVVTLVLARTRLGAIVALGIQGLAVALIFLVFGAPDLAFTQLLVETLSVVILALVMARLNLSANDPRPFEDWLRDGGLAIVVGGSACLLLLRVLEGTFDGRLSTFFAQNSVATAHGRNIVNVILVDFRGLDTLGEIAVVMTAGIAVLALLRRQHKRGPQTDSAKRAPRRKVAAV
ncbi:MAG: hydrogen gas-evolving membrane-bound hydrogenase subunit E [Devosia sp.]